ncbi:MULTISPECIES: Dps family protein [Sulfitobacter]|uniref:DNA starvation/stationary phase protection protein n=1 Tax=Sulfitobacter profundi TaxID=2679961 RepID=A0ABW1Z404_9RHOB|nr:DNA starvation/stationary phase protection protein [Sulfitobacter indolifex]
MSVINPKTSTANISNVASVADALSEALSATYRLVMKSHMYHWNVIGPHFLTLHELTETHYTNMFAAADVIAERIRALGKPAVIDPSGLGRGAEGRDADVSLPADEMLRDLLSDNERLAARMRALVGTAEAAEDPVTADLATTRADFHEKAAWMLRATAG